MNDYSPGLRSALRQLNRLIEQGIEYPDAEYKIAKQTGYMQSELRAAYDNQFAATGRLPAEEE